MQSYLEIADGHGADLLQFVPLVLVQFLAKGGLIQGKPSYLGNVFANLSQLNPNAECISRLDTLYLCDRGGQHTHFNIECVSTLSAHISCAMASISALCLLESDD